LQWGGGGGGDCHSAWPEEMASLRKLKMLTFEGNDQLKELPFFDQFPELRSLKVRQGALNTRPHTSHTHAHA
jgi:hypothetical protein